ncbi:hypothetical protein [Kibdelosporangium phytohabitans]|uniref:Uncharacterized protein n=1 Tax=Kibdelosporangium phytohabitans TaxID=860235 RepID=A0A0N9I828_9PSEU|nr:hypothetical protein [Kibdelosporangium phytohabitans]ALG12022.1 hypothetical protein AOZ06_38735 [Kibdelosporangium phytohabitans]MBE1463495.1 hypothetical protein [Kibdelosporangium phytohabitans]
MKSLFTTALTALPAGVSRWVKLALEAIKRGVEKLLALVPDGLEQKIRDWAKEWWDDHSVSVGDALMRRMSSAQALLADVAAFPAKLAQANPSAEVLDEGARNLHKLGKHHARIVKFVNAIMKVLAKLVASLGGLFKAAAACILAAGGLGVTIALGYGIWLGRDYLDSGSTLQYIPGVRHVMQTVAG